MKLAHYPSTSRIVLVELPYWEINQLVPSNIFSEVQISRGQDTREHIYIKER